MKTYRIWCRYEPELRRLGGQVKGSKRRIVKRGAWRVVDVGESDYPKVAMLDARTAHIPPESLLGMASPRPQRVGTLVDPFKLLKAWQASRKIDWREP